MPLVHVRYASEVSHEERMRLSRLLPGYVALAFTCDDEDGELTTSDIEVFFDLSSQYDVTQFQLNIEVEAIDFPSRVANLPDRVKHLHDQLYEETNYSFGLWVKLLKAGWAEEE